MLREREPEEIDMAVRRARSAPGGALAGHASYPFHRALRADDDHRAGPAAAAVGRFVPRHGRLADGRTPASWCAPVGGGVATKSPSRRPSGPRRKGRGSHSRRARSYAASGWTRLGPDGPVGRRAHAVAGRRPLHASPPGADPPSLFSLRVDGEDGGARSPWTTP